MDYTSVTEAPGNRITATALEMICTRYSFAASWCKDKEVLEVACGAGQGLGLLGNKAKRVIGGDYTGWLLQEAHQHYGERVPLVQLDAHTLPFRSRSFDVVLLYEAIYYLSRPDRFLTECRRVLRKNGMLLLCTVNKEWEDFNPSPYSTRYYSAQELKELLDKEQFQCELYGAFPVEKRSVRDVLVSALKRAAVTFNVMPKTMKGKEFFKRLFLGKLVPFPSEVTDGPTQIRPLSRLSAAQHQQFRILYAIGRNS